MLSFTPICAFSDNYIWHLSNGNGNGNGNEHWVVDPGEATPVIEALKGDSLNGILITHHHFDHTGGIAALHKRYQCPVYGPESIKGVTNRLEDGDSLTLLGLPIRVWSIPGHTLDHLAFILEEESPAARAQTHLFCGDTLFAAGCGRLFEGTPEQMLHSLEKLGTLPGSTQVYCAHEYTVGNLNFAKTIEPSNTVITQRLVDCQALRANGKPTLPSNIALELATNPFLRCGAPEVAQSGAKHLGSSDPSELDDLAIFASLRDWKDHF